MGLFSKNSNAAKAVESQIPTSVIATPPEALRQSDGRVAEPLVNLRFTVSVPELLAEVPGLTREPTLVNQSDFYGDRFPFGVLAPAIATARFNVSGTGSAPGI